ncbi:MAG: hypothetical protein IJW63_02685 [Lachnospiraceae bacterium]|nr:hypothetical protein [Lachnospiraceae bacterium]
MKDELAQAILKDEMHNWKIVETVSEIKNIQIISEIKYDDYQQYTQGMRYIESIALWLRQFDTPEEKQLAYEFVKNQLIYISEEEMRQLVMYVFPLKMKKYLLDKTRKFCDKKEIKSVEERKGIYSYFRRSSLFLGLSDGAHMDFFRRQNPELSNEQVFVHYDFSQAKADDMRKEFCDDEQVKKIQNSYAELEGKDFSTFFLIDDFTGSGRSFIRRDDSGWHGKINKFIELLERDNFDYKSADIHVILYISTEKSLGYIKKQLESYVAEKELQAITVEAVQIVEPIELEGQKELLKLLESNYQKYIDLGYKSYEDKHFKKGDGKYPYLGFADCSLPLILSHNTPNNSLPVLWYSWGEQVNALFPRVTRHKEM